MSENPKDTVAQTVEQPDAAWILKAAAARGTTPWFLRPWIALLRLGFYLLYNELAWTYDLVSWIVSLGHWRHWQRTVIPRLQGERILELAFGTGNLQLDLAAAGFQPVGVDLSPHMVRISRRKLRRAGVPLRLARARAQTLPFPSATFDTLIATFPSDYIVHPRTLHEIVRVLRPGGKIIIVAGGFLVGGDLLSRLIEFAYTITAQRGDLPDVGKLLAPFDLSAHMEEERVGPTRVQLIVAIKTT